MPCIPLGHAENFRKCIDARLLCVFSLVRIGLIKCASLCIDSPCNGNNSKCLSSIYITVFVTRALGHLTVVCSLPWPLNRSEARGDLVLSGAPNVNFRKISFRKTI